LNNGNQTELRTTRPLANNMCLVTAFHRTPWTITDSRWLRDFHFNTVRL